MLAILFGSLVGMEGIRSMDDSILLTHRHDFFRVKNLGVPPSTCFVLMPFASAFDLVYEMIQDGLEGLMEPKRADDISGSVGGPILEKVLRGIATAELIIADLTGRNANVFYEVGIAHTRTKNVLLLTQQLADVPFDLRSLVCHQYDVSSTTGRLGLKSLVRSKAEEVARKRTPATLEDSVTRTKLINERLELILKSDAPRPLIRIQAGISSLGNLPLDRGSAETEDTVLLDRERSLLLDLAKSGALIQVILSPHRVRLGPSDLAGDWERRIERVLEFLSEVDAPAPPGKASHPRCEVVLCPTPGPNLLFLGDEVLFEGHKTGIERGFGYTMVFTDPQIIRVRTGIFDRLFRVRARRHATEVWSCRESASCCSPRTRTRKA
jgi:hypothetical protein